MNTAIVTDPDDILDLRDLFGIPENEEVQFVDVFTDHISGESCYKDMTPIMTAICNAAKAMVRRIKPDDIQNAAYNLKQIIQFNEAIDGPEETLAEAAYNRIEKITLRVDHLNSPRNPQTTLARVTCYGIKWCLDCPDAQFLLVIRNSDGVLKSVRNMLKTGIKTDKRFWGSVKRNANKAKQAA